MKWSVALKPILFVAFALAACVRLNAQGGLVLVFADKGLEKIAFSGQTLEDTRRWPEDGLHIWHMKCLDAATGSVRQDGEYGWGENKQTKTWDQKAHIATYTFVWGQIRVQYLQEKDDTLLVRVQESNKADSGVILDGASIYPVTLHLPSGASAGGIVDGWEEPVQVSASWSKDSLTLLSTDALYAGFQPAKADTLSVLVSSTGPDALAHAGELQGRRVPPGKSDTFSVALRFSQSPTATSPDTDFVAQMWTKSHPDRLRWPDRRVLGTVYLASSGQGEKTHPAGFPTNPRRYFNDSAIDVTNAMGLRKFQVRVLAQASEVVANLRRLHAQGAVTWDIEGEQYPQDTSYVCAPDQIAHVAPEMEAQISAGLSHAGEKLDDAYFHIIRDAGFRIGLCVRPQRFVLLPDGSASQQFLPVDQVAANLIRKMRWAHDRWGITIFYLDSTVREFGLPLPASVIEEAAAALPDSLLIPEESTPRMYAVAAPFRSFIFHGDTGVPPGIRFFYPHAFVANLVNDVDPAKLAAHHAELVESVRQGDILMVHADSWNPNNGTVLEIYREAGRPTSEPAIAGR